MQKLRARLNLDDQYKFLKTMQEMDQMQFKNGQQKQRKKVSRQVELLCWNNSGGKKCAIPAPPSPRMAGLSKMSSTCSLFSDNSMTSWSYKYISNK